MRVHRCLALVAALLPCAAGAQTTTADGVQALIRGDYATAARTLRPLAEASSEPDPLAQFFMAMLYQAGRGVPPSPFRACGLYKSAAIPTNPLMNQSLVLGGKIEETLVRLPPPFNEACSAKELWHDPPSVSLTLGQGHSVAIDRTGGTVAYAQAQTSTGDGVGAFVRGDYQRAAEILQPIAEKSPSPDYAAKLLMGTLYENGLGIAADRTRACVLYMLAADPRQPTPFALVADTLLRAMRESMTREEFENCELLSSIGFDHGFQPVTFVLEAGHWISLDLKGATITYGGKETRIARPMDGGYGTVFLPLEHTELMVGPSRSMRRHFVEVSMWVPARDRQTWTLTWRLLEVVRNELIGITSESPVTISAQEPPTAPPFDVHEFARVRVNASGDAEWAVLAGQRQRTGAIESDAARQEEQQQKLARAAAEARVDWKLTRDVHRAPSMMYVDGNGCGNAFVYGWSDDRTEVISVRADKNLLQLSTTSQTFDLALQPTGIEAVVHVYERPTRSWPFCTDAPTSPGPDESWRAVRGSVTIELSPPGVRAVAPYMYRATIRLVGAEFVSATGVRVKQTQPITLTAIVGWISG